jgi:hypothetical protein
LAFFAAVLNLDEAYPPVSSTGPETHAKHLSLSYAFDLLRVFPEVSRRHLYYSLFQKLTDGDVVER